MNSMTGYGRATSSLAGRTLTVQVSSVNRRSLDLSVGLPKEWEALEPGINGKVRTVATRGKVHVDIELGRKSRDAGVSWDDDAVNAALERLATFTHRHRIDFKADTALVWQIANSMRQAEELPSSDEAQAAVAKALDEALRSFAAMRAREGEALLVDFLKRLNTLGLHVSAIAAKAPTVPVHQREQLMRRLREAGLELRTDDERVLKEIALFADRCDISEELTRLRSHIDQLSHLLRAEGEIGRKAEFLLQELGREVNTIGSKANDLTISRHVIELKNELERVREQMANVE